MKNFFVKDFFKDFLKVIFIKLLKMKVCMKKERRLTPVRCALLVFSFKSACISNDLKYIENADRY